MLISRLEYIRVVLNRAADQGGPGNPTHQGSGRFWNQSRDEFVDTVVYGEKMIVLGDPANSALVKALRGWPPFDGTKYTRMPMGRDPVRESDIEFIEQWIRDKCPDPLYIEVVESGRASGESIRG